MKLSQVGAYIMQLSQDPEHWKYRMDDLEHYIFEAAVTHYYGNEVWNWVNEVYQ